MKLTLALLVLLAPATLAAAPLQLPDGWSLPTDAQLSFEDRSKSAHRYARITADFNGDGQPDEALLAVSTRTRGEGLLVHLSTGKEEYRWMVLDTVEWGNTAPQGYVGMGVDLLKPGKHRFICIERAGTCIEPTSQKNTVSISNPAIDYFRFESASSFFYWDKKTQGFIRVWQSD